MKKKTIFWSSFISILMTLTLVSYLSDVFGRSGENKIYIFLQCFGLVVTLLSVPATLVFRLLFGKIKSIDNDFYYFFILAIVAISFVIIDQILLFFEVTENYVIRMIISLIAAIFFTKKFLGWVFTKANNIKN